jgi:hypothetical protein
MGELALAEDLARGVEQADLMLLARPSRCRRTTVLG